MDMCHSNIEIPFTQIKTKGLLFILVLFVMLQKKVEIDKTNSF